MALIRTFIGIHLTFAIQDNLDDLIAQLEREPEGQAARWAAVENIHLTLKFMGDIESDNLETLCQAVSTAAATVSPFHIAIADLGCFPNARRPRIVWVGVQEKSGALYRLHQVVQDTSFPLGYERETRAFLPHLTIARVKRQATRSDIVALGQTVSGYGPIELGEMVVDSVCVIRSDLRPTGAVYTDLCVANLGGSF